MTALTYAGFAISSFLVTWLMLPVINEMLIEAGFVRPNFRREQIPLGVGLVFFLASLIVIVIGRFMGLVDGTAYTFLFAVGGMGLFGLIDDVFGTRGASGLKGHFKKLFVERELTTGALKALAGLLIAVLVSLQVTHGEGLYRWLFLGVNVLIVAFSTNAVNLLDLRPGRAGKGYLVISLFVILASGGQTQLYYLAAVTGSLIAFMPFDLKAVAMMGDTGSNMLGMTLGFTAVFTMNLPLKVGYLLFLLAFHLLTEKYSLTKLIEKNRVLNYLDMMGRRQPESGE